MHGDVGLSRERGNDFFIVSFKSGRADSGLLDKSMLGASSHVVHSRLSITERAFLGGDGTVKTRDALTRHEPRLL